MDSPRLPVERRDLPPREGVWFAEPRPVRRTSKAIPGWWVPFASDPMLYGVLARYVGAARPAWLTYVQLAGYLFFLILAVVWRISEEIALRATSRDRAFSDRPAGIVEYLVELVIVAGGREIGADRGVVWFENDAISFNGSSCSFVLSAQDFAPRPKAKAFGILREGPSDALHLRTGRGAYIRVSPLRGWRRIVFGYRLGRFLAEGKSTGEPRQWPPLRSYALAARREATGPGASLGPTPRGDALK